MTAHPLEAYRDARAEERLRFLGGGWAWGVDRVLYLAGRAVSLDQEFWGDSLLRDMRSTWALRRLKALGLPVARG